MEPAKSAPGPRRRHDLRQILRAVLPTDSDFSAFCVDFFPAVAERFVNSMDRLAKATLLLELAPPSELVAALREHDPQRFAGYESSRPSVESTGRNPYRGLSAFQLDEAHLFFGREALTGALWQRLEALHEKLDATRLLAIVGPSGSGKSSVARAGLLAALVQSPIPGPQPMRFAIVKPGERPIESLARALVPLLPADSSVLPAKQQVAIEDLLRDEKMRGEGLRRFAADLPDIATSPLVVFVDQCEEIYTLCEDAAERDRFVELLLQAAQSRSVRVSVILTLRSDFLGETQRHHNALNRLIAEQGVMVPGLSPEELRTAIAKPAEHAGRPLDAATVDLLLAEAHSNQGALPLLEFALTRIWEGMERGEEPGATLRQIGGVGGALAGEAQKIYKTLTDAEQETARRALVRLVRLGEGTRDTRRRAALSELCGRGETEAQVLAVLRKFSAENARLVTLGVDGAEAVAEVTHEALFEHWIELRKWIDEGRADRRLHDRATKAARMWDADRRPSRRLWRRPDLDLLHAYGARKPEELSPLLGAFLSDSKAQQRRESAVRWGSVLAVFLAMLVASGVYVTKEKQRAHESRLRIQALADSTERSRQQYLDTYVERARQLLLEEGSLSEAVLRLQRARAGRSTNPLLPELMHHALLKLEATRVALVGHERPVLFAAYSPDGKRIATASLDTTARVWDAGSGRPLAVLKGHQQCVWTAAFSPDGKRIVTASDDKTARVWDAESGRTIAVLEGHQQSVMTAAYSPDGTRIVTASEDKTARVWAADSGRPIAVLKGHQESVLTAAFSPDGTRIVTASPDNTARVWDADSGRPLAARQVHQDSVVKAAFSPDGTRIVTASDDKTARVWDADSGRSIAVLLGHQERVWTAAYSPDGKHIVTASLDKTARIWDADSGQPLGVLKGHQESVVTAAYDPDGKRIVTASLDNTARVWDTDSGRTLAVLRGHQSSVSTAAYSPDGKSIITASLDNTARVWDTDFGRPLFVLPRQQDRFWTAAYSPDGKRIVTVSDDNTAQVRDADSGRPLAVLKGHQGSIHTAAYSPDGKRIVTASWDTTARVWDADSGRPLAVLRGHQDIVWTAAYSPDGKRIVTVGDDNTARVWDADSGRHLAVLQGYQNSAETAAFSPDSKHIVTVSDDNTARVWDADSGRHLAVLQGHQNRVNSAAYSPNGKRIVTTSWDNTARVWDADSGRPLAVLQGHHNVVNTAAYSPDGKRIVTASWDTTARVWDADSGRPLAMLQGHQGNVGIAAYSSDGKRIVTASDDHTARVWDADSGRALAVLQGHQKSVLTAAYSPDSKRIVTVSEDNTARVWDVAPESRTAAEIDKLIRCRLFARFASDDSDVIVPALPNPGECLPPSQPVPSH